MKDIKTRESKRDIKTLDRAAGLAKVTKNTENILSIVIIFLILIINEEIKILGIIKIRIKHIDVKVIIKNFESIFMDNIILY